MQNRCSKKLENHCQNGSQNELKSFKISLLRRPLAIDSVIFGLLERCQNIMFFLVPLWRFKKSKSWAKMRPKGNLGDKEWGPGGGLSGAVAPRGRPQVHARVKRKKGTAERKKNQERKSKACGKRYKGIWTRQWPEAWRILREWVPIGENTTIPK